ncbi:MAG: Fur family transcriptional regulator [Lachnospiraceae bacterium]
MRYSKQSEEVLNTVLNSNNHPDAKEIYELVKLKIPNVSLGTVYRNLNTLAKEGLIRKIELDDGNDRFDKTLCQHNHLKCTTCGKVIDIAPKLDQKEIKEIESKTGFKITDSSFNINGICEKCKKERNY